MICCFNPRTRTGCDGNNFVYNSSNLGFQSTHPHGVRPGASLKMPLLSGFNPRTRTGCDVYRPCQLHNIRVSIHAPARGATTQGSQGRRYGMFQSTHPHGVRPITFSISIGQSLFQSTHPHGVRLRRPSAVSDQREFQSTHPHGVRHYVGLLLSLALQFQSTHPHGVRLAQALHADGKYAFQSTHPHGVRPYTQQ